MKNKKIIIFLIICIVLMIIGICIFFNKNTANNLKIGNNTTSQEIVDYILNISSYEAKVEVEVKSNKNTNKYILKQQYISPDISIQEILEPSNVLGVKITKNGNQLKVENTNLGLSTIFENYEYLSDNILDLECFIKEYKENEKSGFREENNKIIMNTSNNNKQKELHINKENGIPIKMEIKDTNKNTNVYILYNEININDLKKENVLAFEVNFSKMEI